METLIVLLGVLFGIIFIGICFLIKSIQKSLISHFNRPVLGESLFCSDYKLNKQYSGTKKYLNGGTIATIKGELIEYNTGLNRAILRDKDSQCHAVDYSSLKPLNE